MQIKEAIDYMENEIRCIHRANFCDRNCAKCELVKEDFPLIEAFGEAINALKKQIPMKAVIHGERNREVNSISYTCPECKSHVDKCNYCSNCGQAIIF